MIMDLMIHLGLTKMENDFNLWAEAHHQLTAYEQWHKKGADWISQLFPILPYQYSFRDISETRGLFKTGYPPSLCYELKTRDSPSLHYQIVGNWIYYHGNMPGILLFHACNPAQISISRCLLFPLAIHHILPPLFRSHLPSSARPEAEQR